MVLVRAPDVPCTRGANSARKRPPLAAPELAMTDGCATGPVPVSEPRVSGQFGIPTYGQL